MPSPLLLCVLTASVVLLVSGWAKLRDPQSVEAGFESMRVPAVLDRPLVRRGLPWAEVALGAWLLLASGPALVVVGVLTLALFLAYLVLVALAVQRPEPVDCGCFGALGDSRVTPATVWRNGLLVLTAALVVLAGVRGESLIRAGVDGGVWGWVAASALTAAVAVLVTWRPDDAPDAGSAVAGTSGPEVDADGDFTPTRAPAAALLDEQGTLVLLEDEVRTAAHLLVFVKARCGSCAVVIPLVPEWDEQLGPVAVRAVVHGPTARLGLLPHLRGRAYSDPFGITRSAFGAGAPSAVLVGTDGMIAGGPVHGSDAVVEFVAEVAEHLREAELLVSDDR